MMLCDNAAMEQTLRARLESGFSLLQTIQSKRRLTGCPGLGWAIEQHIIDRELRELEENLSVPFQDVNTGGL
jgi:hypothetical protein